MIFWSEEELKIHILQKCMRSRQGSLSDTTTISGQLFGACRKGRRQSYLMRRTDLQVKLDEKTYLPIHSLDFIEYLEYWKYPDIFKSRRPRMLNEEVNLLITDLVLILTLVIFLLLALFFVLLFQQIREASLQFENELKESHSSVKKLPKEVLVWNTNSAKYSKQIFPYLCQKL